MRMIVPCMRAETYITEVGSTKRRCCCPPGDLMRHPAAIIFGSALWAALLCVPGVSAQETSPSSPHGNSQDVPKQEPGTNNPDVSKQRKQTPSAPDTNPSKNPGD